ncbi:hypothetical protein LTR39_006298, partial [Cryomyces antarcticus]
HEHDLFLLHNIPETLPQLDTDMVSCSNFWRLYYAIGGNAAAERESEHGKQASTFINGNATEHVRGEPAIFRAPNPGMATTAHIQSGSSTRSFANGRADVSPRRCQARTRASLEAARCRQQTRHSRPQSAH